MFALLGDVGQQVVRATGVVAAVLVVWALVARETERLGTRSTRYVSPRARTRRRRATWLSLTLLVLAASVQLAVLL